MIALAWVIFAVIIVAVLVLNTIIVRYFNHKKHSELLPTIVSIISLTLTLLCIALLPVDIYTVSTNSEPEFATVIKALYYGMFH